MTEVDIYTEFHQRPPRHSFKLRLPASVRVPARMAQLGVLQKLCGRLGALSYDYIIEFPRKDKALLLCTADGVLYLYDPLGGLVSVPIIFLVEYYTDKQGEGPGSYVHDFKKPYPRLEIIPGTRDKLARLAGGGYTIEERGIVG